jgi:hypothetical protein
LQYGAASRNLHTLENKKEMTGKQAGRQVAAAAAGLN